MHLVISAAYLLDRCVCSSLFNGHIIIAGYFWKAMFGEYLTK